MSAKVEQLCIRRVGGLVYVDLPSLSHEGESVTIESGCKDFDRHWNEATYGMNSDERSEANRRLDQAEAEATEFAHQQSRESQDYTGAVDRLVARLEDARPLRGLRLGLDPKYTAAPKAAERDAKNGENGGQD